MTIIIEFFSVIVPVEVIERKYPGGLKEYKADCPNYSFKSSAKITNIAFIDSTLLDQFILRLIELGFEYDEINHLSKDFVVAERLTGFSWGVDWAQFKDGAVTSWED